MRVRIFAAAALVAAATMLVPVTATAHSAWTTPPAPARVACPGCWKPAVNTSWNWVISHVPTRPFHKVKMYDIDGFEASAATVAALHAAGIKVVCYLSAGTYENFRPDAARFPVALIGRANGWPGEKWLDIRDAQKVNSRLLRILDARLDMCHSKKFDMVEFDNVDGYTNSTGFALTSADQVYFNATMANHAHARGMSALLKNDVDQIPALLPYFDGALNEQCNEYHECTTSQNGSYGYDQFVAARKPVFQAEYNLTTSQFCRKDNISNFNGLRFNINLDDSIFQPCR